MCHRPLWFWICGHPQRALSPKKTSSPNSFYISPKAIIHFCHWICVLRHFCQNLANAQNGGAAEDYSILAGITNIGFSSTHSLNIIYDHQKHISMCNNHQPCKEPATENWQRTIPTKEQRLILGAANGAQLLEVACCSESCSRVPSSKAGGGSWRG